MKEDSKTLSDKIINNDLQYAKTLTNDSLNVRIESDYAIHLAIRHNRLDMVIIFLNINSKLVNQINYCGESPLIVAARYGWQSICEYLIVKNADLNGVINYAGASYNGFNALLWARVNKQQNMIKTLIKAGAVDDICCNGYYGFLIHQAAVMGWSDIIKSLIGKNPALINQVNKSGQSPLILAVKYQQKNICTYLLSQNAAPNLEMDCVGDKEHGYTALCFAISNKDEVTIKNLIAAGAIDKSFNGHYLIHKAVIEGWIDIVKLLIEKDPDLANQEDKYGQTPLMFAFKKELTLFGIGIGIDSEHSKRCLQMTQCLVSLGARVNAVSNDGVTVLDFAEGSSAEVVKFLITASDYEKQKACEEEKRPPVFSSSPLIMYPNSNPVAGETMTKVTKVQNSWDW